jgi:hypothetical protein
MKRCLFFFLGLISSGIIFGQVPIEPYFFGLNYWKADQDVDFDATDWQKVNASGCNILRFGGIQPNLRNPILDTVMYKDSIMDRFNAHQKNGLIQLPYRPHYLFHDVPALPDPPYTPNSSHNLAYWADYAYQVVLLLKNNGYTGLTYAIANEPNNCLICPNNRPKGYGYSLTNNADLDSIVSYVRAFSAKIKAADPTAKVSAPAISFYSKNALKYMFKDASVNLGGTISGTGTGADGKFYVDVISFNMYAPSLVNCNSPNRSAIIDYPKNSFAVRLQEIVDEIIIPLSGRDASNMRIAVTEYNMGEILCSNYDADELAGADARSFLAGQWIADMMANSLSKGTTSPNAGYVSGMFIWSFREGTPDRGMIRKNDYKERSSYWHFKYMADYFKGNYYPGTTNGGNFKAFGSKSNKEIAVIILNQDTVTTASRIYTIRLDNTTPGTTNWAKMNMGINKSFTDTIKASSTTLLVFDCVGNIKAKYRYEQTDPNNPFKSAWAPNQSVANITNQSQFNAHAPGIYSAITIGTGSSTITVPNAHNTVFEFMNTGTVYGNFTVPLGETFTLLPVSASCE